MWELNHKESWVPNNWCFLTVVLEKTLEKLLDSKAMKPVKPTGNQPWVFIGRTDAKAEAPILWSPDGKIRITGNDLDADKDWGHEEKGATEDEIVGWHHQLNGHESEQTPEASEGQGSLLCCSSWGDRVRHDLATEQWLLYCSSLESACSSVFKICLEVNMKKRKLQMWTSTTGQLKDCAHWSVFWQDGIALCGGMYGELLASFYLPPLWTILWAPTFPCTSL